MESRSFDRKLKPLPPCALSVGANQSERGEASKLRGMFLWPCCGERRPSRPGGGVVSRIIAVTASGFVLAACSVTMPSLSLDFMKSAPQDETLAIESEPPAAEAKTSLGQSCRTPCQLRVQSGSEFSVTLTLSGYQPQTVSVRPEAGGASAAPRLAPNPIHVDLQAGGPPQKPGSKEKKPGAAAGRPAA